MKLFDLLVGQRRFVYLAIGLLSGAGVWAALHLPSAIYPELVFPRVTIVAEGSALGARRSPLDAQLSCPVGSRSVTRRRSSLIRDVLVPPARSFVRLLGRYAAASRRRN